MFPVYFQLLLNTAPRTADNRALYGILFSKQPKQQTAFAVGYTVYCVCLSSNL